MSPPLRIAMFVGAFPVLSETFIVRQITGLLDSGCEVDTYADCRSSDSKVQPDVTERRLLERVTWMDMPAETSPVGDAGVAANWTNLATWRGAISSQHSAPWSCPAGICVVCVETSMFDADGAEAI